MVFSLLVRVKISLLGEVSAREEGAQEVSARQVGTLEASPREASARQVSIREVGAPGVSVREVGAGEVGTNEASPREVTSGGVRARAVGLETVDEDRGDPGLFNYTQGRCSMDSPSNSAEDASRYRTLHTPVARIQFLNSCS